MSTLPGHPIQDRTLEDQAPGDIQMTDTSLPSPYLSQIPRAILYWSVLSQERAGVGTGLHRRRKAAETPLLVRVAGRNPTSVWSTVPRLALCEKGYADSAFNLVEVGLIFS